MIKFIIIIVSMLFPLVINAQEKPIQTDRPDQTETPSLVPKKYFQLEAGFLYEKINNQSKSYQHPSVLYKYGVSDNFELRLITQFETQKQGSSSRSGLAPVIIGFKGKLLQENGCVPATSFIGHLAIPKWASEDLQAEFYAPSFRFAFQHTLSEKVGLSYNLGAEWEGETPEPTFIYTLSSNFSISEKIGTYIEVYGFAPQQSKADHRFDAGLTYLTSNNAQLDVSGGFGLTNNAPKYFFVLGYSFRLKTK